jgi:hypothetical protein
MAEIIGRQLEFGIGVETTRGTAVTTADKWFRNVTANVVPRTQKVGDDSTRGVLEDSLGARVVRQWYEGEIAGVLHADAFGYLLYNLYGSVVSTLVTGSVHTHAFSMSQSIEHPTLTIFRKDGSVNQDVFGGGVISTLEVSASTEDYIRFTANAMARTGSSNADSPTYTATDYDFIARDITIKVAATEGGLSSATAVPAKTLSIRYDVGAIADYVFGAKTANDIYNAMMSIEVEFSKNYEDTTFEDLYNADTYRYMQIQIAGEVDIGSGNYPTITWIFNRVQVQDWNRSGDANSLVEETVVLKAFYNSTDGEQSTVTLKNLTAEYEPE